MVANGTSVLPVWARTTWAWKVMSASEIRETTEVALRSSMALLPKVGSITSSAWGRMTWRKDCQRPRLSATQASYCSLPIELDGAAHDLGPVGADIEAERQDARLQGRERDAEEGQHEIGPEELDEDRGAAEELDIGGRQRPHRGEARHAAEPGEEGHHQRQRRTQDGELDGDERTLQDQADIAGPLVIASDAAFRHGRPLPGGAAGQPARRLLAPRRAFRASSTSPPWPRSRRAR